MSTALGTVTLAAHQVMVGLFGIFSVSAEPLNQTAQSFMPRLIQGSSRNTKKNTANPIYTDSQSALAVAKNPVFHARTKHIEVHYHYFRERLPAREINLAYVPTQNNLADLLTKALFREKLEAFRKALGLLPFVD
ncbi:hypothetical protein L7F22_003632 [Adiantum nelumboides]|nr:hypothetical protein [Adiantum nelumboides]